MPMVTGQYLAFYLSERIRIAVIAAEHLDDDQLSANTDGEIVDALFSDWTVPKLQVDLQNGRQLQPIESRQTGRPRSRPRTIAYQIAFPYTGPTRDIVKLLPSRQVDPYVHALMEASETDIFFTHSTSDPNAEEVNAFFKNCRDGLNTIWAFFNEDIANFEIELRSEISNAVLKRRRWLDQAKSVSEALDYPLLPRQGVPRQVPMKRRVEGLQRATDTGMETTAASYRLAEEDYEDIIRVIQYTMVGFERTPATYHKLAEEDLRNLLLGQLNGVYEGQATGETFNQDGKADILVRKDNLNIFVAECKKWDGSEKFKAAIDQLLRYVTWRDEKAALILFIDQVNAMAAIDSAFAALLDHELCEGEVEVSGALMNRRDVMLHRRDDPSKKIRVALLPVVIRPEG